MTSWLSTILRRSEDLYNVLLILYHYHPTYARMIFDRATFPTFAIMILLVTILRQSKSSAAKLLTSVIISGHVDDFRLRENMD